MQTASSPFLLSGDFWGTSTFLASRAIITKLRFTRLLSLEILLRASLSLVEANHSKHIQLLSLIQNPTSNK